MRADGRPSAPSGDTLPNIRVVLVRPLGSANVGSAARAMKNMGVGELTLVQPAVRRYAAAEAMAVHARDLVRRARVVQNLAAAVADCALVVGTTCRGGPYRAAAEAVETLAPTILAAAAHGPVALVFGPEDHGLSNDDLRHCQRLVTIDTSAQYASLNLAQAVLLVCYDLRRVARGAAATARVAAPARAGAVQRMYEHLQRALLRIGFLHPQNPEHLMFALRRLFGRARLDEQEVRILLGIARQIEWFARAGRKAATDTAPGVTGDRLPVTGGDSICNSAELESGTENWSQASGYRSRLFPPHG
jgi:tRNA/rRNA methyltransferase